MNHQFNFDTQLTPPQPPHTKNRLSFLATYIKNWWNTVDRTLLIITIGLVFFGTVMSFSASPSVAKDINASTWSLASKQLKFSIPILLGMMWVSSLSLDNARRLAIIGFLGTLVLLFLLIFMGDTTKGANRWLPIPFIGTIQPTEFLKPTFVVVSAWFLSAWRLGDDIPGHWIAGGLFALSLVLVAIQPDLGQSLLLTSAFLMQIFVLGITLRWIAIAGVGVLLFFAFMYISFAHVRDRIEQFLNPAPYSQLHKSLEAFSNGGFWGTGWGNGTIKMNIADVHTDFIFAVIGEEGGFFGATIFIGILLFVFHRCMTHLSQEKNLFIVLSAGALTWLLMAQSAINISSTMGIIPTKGMTLPFVSSGVSSLLGTCFGMGLILSFTRKNKFR